MTYKTSVTRDQFHSETQAFFKGKRVAIAGGTGFIGSHVVEMLLELGAQPVVMSRRPSAPFLESVRGQIEWRVGDLAHKDQVLRAFDGCPIVLSLAAQVAGLEYNAKHSASIFQNNLESFFNSIWAAKELKVERFLTTSSACVYPRFCSIPTPESEGTVGEPEPTNSGYGWAKRMEEYLSKKYNEEFGLSVAVARPYNAYGPRDNFDPKSSHVIPALIRKAFEAPGGEFEVWGQGDHSRSFLYVDDFARGLVETAARFATGEAVNIGANEEVTIGDCARMIGEMVSQVRERPVAPRFNSSGLTGQPRRRCDTTMAERELGYRAQVKFQDGLLKTIRWYANENRSLSSH